MKEYLKALLKYLITILIIFILSAASIIGYNLLMLVNIPATEIETSQYLGDLALKALFISIFSSLIISNIIYGLFELGKQKNLFFSLLIPLILSTGLMALNLYLLNPDSDKLTIKKLENGRLYLLEGTFMKYHEELPGNLSEREFNTILLNIKNEDDRQIIKASYLGGLGSSGYSLKSGLYYNRKARLLDILYSVDYFETIYFHFGKVYKNHVRDMSYYKMGEMRSFRYVPIEYDRGEAVLNIPGKEDKYRFNHLLAIERKIFIFPVNEIFERLLKNFNEMFISPKAKYITLIFWFSIFFFLLSLLGIINTGNYPLFTILLRVLTAMLIIVFINLLYENIPEYTVSIWSSAVMGAVAALITILSLLLRKKDDRSNA